MMVLLLLVGRCFVVYRSCGVWMLLVGGFLLWRSMMWGGLGCE